MKHYAFFFLVFIPFIGLSQLKQQTADKFFAAQEYSKCVEMFDELVAKCAKKPKKCHIDNTRKAAISHFHLYEMKEAVRYFEQLKKSKAFNEKDHELYIQALRFDKRYSEAESQINEAHVIYPNNTFFSSLYNQKASFNRLFKDSAQYILQKTQISSLYGDFCPTYFQDGIVYATKSKNADVLRGKYGWDDAYYISLLQSKIEDDTLIENGKLLKHKFLSKAHDGPVDFNTEENLMVITKNFLGMKKGKETISLGLYFSSFDGKKWNDLTPFPYNSKEYNVGHGCFSHDGKTLYFASDMPGGIGGSDIYKSSFENGQWSQPENLGSTINTDKNELFPFVNGDQLFFASNGHFGVGGLDIFEANLKTQKVENMGYPLNSSADDFGLITDSTGLAGYFSSNRENAVDGIYAFDKVEIYMDVIVQVFEKYEENEIVPSHPITLINTNSGEEEEFYSNSDGELHLRVKKDELYTFSTQKQDFKLKNPVELSTKNVNVDTTFRCELILLPTKITIALKVIAKDTKKPIDMATTSIANFNFGKDTVMMTNKNGLVTINVDRNKDYVAHGAKKGYIDDQKSFNTSHEDGKIIELQLELTPIKKGEKFKLENIFYDLNKSTLRPESMAALDKLADFIVKNDLRIELSAHTDSRGSATYNQRLSQARAQSCVDYLLSKGVKKSQIVAKGYGESKLINKCKDGVSCSEDEHQDNRRTEVKILEVN